MLKIIIGLHDADAEHIKNKKFPNYALMKISAWHKQRGDTTEMFIPVAPNELEQLSFLPSMEYPPHRKGNIYDIVYSSKIFDFTPENPFLPAHTIKGGTGYDIKGKLPLEIDEMFPDYSIYPKCDYAIGFITRGCTNNCSWCYVPAKEGKIKPYKKWQEIIRQDTNKLVLMDNNILASEYGISQLKELAKTDIIIDLNQGMDIRLVTEDLVKLFGKLKWINYIRFSCDTKEQLPYFKQLNEWFKKYSVSTSKVFIYVLVRKDLDNADERVQILHNINKSFNLYAQAERNEGKGIIPNKLQLEFAQRYIYGRLYKKENWKQYCKRHEILLVS